MWNWIIKLGFIVDKGVVRVGSWLDNVLFYGELKYLFILLVNYYVIKFIVCYFDIWEGYFGIN